MTDIKKIAIHYLKGSCIFDFLAIVPFKDIFSSFIGKRSKLRLFSLFKLLRVPRLFGLLNVERFKQSITAYYNNKLEEKVRKNIETENYPILKQLMYVQLYKIIRLVLIIFTFSYFLGILWHILVTDLMPTDLLPNGDWEDNFNSRFLLKGEGEEALAPELRLAMVWYFAFTTLSTIGFGDFVPISI